MGSGIPAHQSSSPKLHFGDARSVRGNIPIDYECICVAFVTSSWCAASVLEVLIKIGHTFIKVCA